MKLNFKKTGGSGQPVIILHGIFGSLDNWISFPKFFNREFTFYLVDQRNHGKSPHSETFNYDVMAGDLREFIDEHQIENPVIVGHSMGGKTAMTFALQYPDMLAKLVVVDIAPRYYPVHHDKIIEGLKSIPLGTITSRNEAEDVLKDTIENEGIRQFLLKNLVRTNEGFSLKINLPVIERNIEHVGVKIEGDPVDMPVLFIRGENSDYIATGDKQDIDHLFPNSHIVTIKGAGHWVHAEKPAEMAATMEQFISG